MAKTIYNQRVAEAVTSLAQECKDYGLIVWIDRDEEEFKGCPSYYVRPTYRTCFFVSDGRNFLIVSMDSKGWNIGFRYRKVGRGVEDVRVVEAAASLSLADIKEWLMPGSLRELAGLINSKEREATEEELSRSGAAPSDPKELRKAVSASLKGRRFSFPKSCQLFGGVDDFEVSGFCVPKRYKRL